MLRRWVWVKIMDQGDRLSDDRGMYPRKSRHLTVILCPGSKTVSGPRRAKRHLPTKGEAFSKRLRWFSAWLRLFRVTRRGGRLVRNGEATVLGAGWLPKWGITWCWIHHSEDPKVGGSNQFVGVNDSKWLKQKSNQRSGRYSNWLSIWLLWISYYILFNIYQTIHYQYHPLSSITWHLFQ